MRYVSLTCLLILLITCGTKKTESIPELYIPKPSNWFDSELDSKNNMKNFTFSTEELNELMEIGEGTINLLSYTKYDEKNHYGSNPTINASLRPNPTLDSESFKNDMQRGEFIISEYLDNYKLIDGLKTVTIDGHKATLFIRSFDLTVSGGPTIRNRCWTYAIPFDTYFYQIDYIDSDIPLEDDCWEIFEQTTNAIKLR